jgi:hypothetical protein
VHLRDFSFFKGDHKDGSLMVDEDCHHLIILSIAIRLTSA